MAISPVDGRYVKSTHELSPYFSEYALMKYRVWVEVEYFIALCELPLPQLTSVSSDTFVHLRDICANFSQEDAQWIKDKEKITNHDVKAVEYFIKDRMLALPGDMSPFVEFIHFGLTSQDINNTAIPLSQVVPGSALNTSKKPPSGCRRKDRPTAP